MSTVVNGRGTGYWITWLLVDSVLNLLKQLSSRHYVLPFTPRTVPTMEEATSSLGPSVSNTVLPGFASSCPPTCLWASHRA